jgi:hypothetical protein
LIRTQEQSTASAADTAPLTPDELLAEMAWVKDRFRELENVHFEALGLELAKWFDNGQEVRVWVVDTYHRCSPATLVRHYPERWWKSDELGEPRASELSEPPDAARDNTAQFGLRTCRDWKEADEPDFPRDCKRRPQRICTYDSVGASWYGGAGSGLETLIDGTFREVSYRIPDTTVPDYGVLTRVDSKHARYGGERGHLRLSAEDETLDCNRVPYCPDNRLVFAPDPGSVPRARGGIMGRSAVRMCSRKADESEAQAKCTTSCDAPCPSPPTPEERRRIARLLHVPVWRTTNPAAALYRVKADCLSALEKSSKLPQPLGETY